MEKDKPLRIKRRGLTMVICAVFLAAMWAVSHSAGFVEDVYARRVSFFTARTLSIVTGVVPMSLAEAALVGVALYLLVPLGITTVRVIQRKRSVRNALAAGGLRISMLAAVVLTLFYFCWGLNYARAPLAARLGWLAFPDGSAKRERPAADGESRSDIDEIATLARQLVEATNTSYREFAGSDDLGRPSVPPAGSPSLDAALDAAYARVQQRLGLESAFAATRGRAKPLAASLLMNHLGLAGFYFPWTGEANYNRLQPGPTLPPSVAHEKAHQRGIALEDEAGFVGYLVCVMSDDPYARYAGYLYASRQLLGELATRNSARALELVGLRVPGVQRDVDFIRAFWLQYQGTAARVSERVNDRYLESQGVKRGIASYAASRNLIVLFARNNGGDARVR